MIRQACCQHLEGLFREHGDEVLRENERNMDLPAIVPDFVVLLLADHRIIRVSLDVDMVKPRLFLQIGYTGKRKPLFHDIPFAVAVVDQRAVVADQKNAG